MDSCTQVLAARHVWGLLPCPVMPCHKWYRFPRPWCLVKSMPYWKLLGGATRCLCPSRVGEGGGLDKHVAKSYLPTSTIMRKRDGVDCFQILFFRLVTPSLQLGVVRSYLVRGVWFLSHLLLEGTDRIYNFGF
jgi:hypothetical protein